MIGDFSKDFSFINMGAFSAWKSYPRNLHTDYNTLEHVSMSEKCSKINPNSSRRITACQIPRNLDHLRSLNAPTNHDIRLPQLRHRTAPAVCSLDRQRDRPYSRQTDSPTYKPTDRSHVRRTTYPLDRSRSMIATTK